MGSPVKYLFVSVVQHCTFVIMCGYFMESTQRIRFFCYLSSVKYQMTYIRSLVMNVAYARRKPPSGATPVRVHTLDRPVMYRSGDVTGLGGRAHVRPQSEPHKGACVSGAPAPTCWAPAPPRAPHPHTYCDRVPRQQPANRAAATARNRRRGAATTAGGAAAPSLAHCPAAEWQPRRLRCLRRPSRGTCEQGEDAVGRLGGRRVAACHRGGRTREGTRRRQRRRPRSRTAAQVCAACAACPSPPPC